MVYREVGDFCSNLLLFQPLISVYQRAKYIPVRLNLKERKMLRLLEAALQVSEYTDKVDIISFKGKVCCVFTCDHCISGKITQELHRLAESTSNFKTFVPFCAGLWLLMTTRLELRMSCLLPPSHLSLLISGYRLDSS